MRSWCGCPWESTDVRWCRSRAAQIPWTSTLVHRRPLAWLPTWLPGSRPTGADHCPPRLRAVSLRWPSLALALLRQAETSVDSGCLGCRADHPPWESTDVRWFGCQLGCQVAAALGVAARLTWAFSLRLSRG